MTIPIPEELYSFGVTSKEYDEKRGVLAKSTETEINENEVFWDLFQDSAEKAVNYEILQMLYWNMASTDSWTMILRINGNGKFAPQRLAWILMALTHCRQWKERWEII